MSFDNQWSPPHPGPLKVLVFGGRKRPNNGAFWEYGFVEHALDEVLAGLSVGLIIHGGAPGIDSLAGAYATNHGIQYCIFPALWQTLEKRAGPVRNKAMLDWMQPDLAVGFPGGTGTADMLGRIETCGVKLISVGE